MTESLEDRTVLITGPSRGIGRALALAVAEAGATVILCGRQSEALEGTYDEIARGPGPEPFLAPLDLAVAGEPDYEALNRAVEERFGALHGLVLNAAMLGPRTPLEFVTAAQWDAVMALNLRSPFLMTRALMPALRAADWAQVIMVSSGVGQRARANWGPYSISKVALEAVASLFHQENEKTTEIAFNVVDPGGTRTAMRAAAYPGEDPATLPTPEEIVPVFLHLLSTRGRSHRGDRLEARDWLQTRL